MIAPKGILIQTLEDAPAGPGFILIQKVFLESSYVQSKIFFYAEEDKEKFEADVKVLYIENPNTIIAYKVAGVYDINFEITLAF